MAAWLIGLLIAYGLAWGLVATPYGFWQRLFIDKIPSEHAMEFFTYAAARGDLRTVTAFLDRGVNINAQGRYGTALHGATVENELAMIEFLIAHGADVNALNAYGDSPLGYATETTPETRALLMKHGGIYIRGSDEQHDRIIKEQVRKDIEREMGRRQAEARH